MKKLSSYVFDHIGTYLIAVACLVIAVVLDMFAPLLTKRIIDEVLGRGNVAILGGILLGYLGIGVGRMICGYVKEYFFDVSGAKIGAAIRRDVFTHIQGLSTEFFDRNDSGELMARVKDDVDRIWDGFSFIGMLMIEVVIHTGMILFCMYRLNWMMALIPTATMIFCGFLAIYMENKLGGIYEEISDETADLNTVAEENLAGVRTVRAFAREDFEIKKFLSHNERFYELNMKQSKTFVRIHPLFSLVGKLLPFAVLTLGGFLYCTQVQPEKFTMGDLAAFVQYSTNIVWPMEMLGWLTNSLSSAAASNKKIKKIVAEVPTVVEEENPVVLSGVNGKVCFDNVSFTRGENTVLSDISFTVEPGKTLGIMGATGSGKSSLIYLLQRLYDCSDGRILLDDVEVKKMSLKQLRSSISVVMQDVFLFSDTIEENVRLGKQKSLTREQVKRAVRDAQAGDFVEKLPENYETVIGERGVGLSGGQKQRISIARAFAKRCPILVMDDSTSALDMETEHDIQKTLKELKGTTKIIIAHRISAVQSADEIIFLKEGKIAERGTHKSLMEKGGLYYETYMAQYGSFLEKKEA